MKLQNVHENCSIIYLMCEYLYLMHNWIKIFQNIFLHVYVFSNINHE